MNKKLTIATLILLTSLGLVVSGCLKKEPRTNTNTNINQNVNTSQNQGISVNTNQDIDLENLEVVPLPVPKNPIDTSDWVTLKSEKYGYEMKIPKDFKNYSGYDGSELSMDGDNQSFNLVGEDNNYNIMFSVDDRYRKIAGIEGSPQIDDVIKPLYKQKSPGAIWIFYNYDNLLIREIESKEDLQKSREEISMRYFDIGTSDNMSDYALGIHVSARNKSVDAFAYAVLLNIKFVK